MAKYLDSTGLAHLWDAIKDYVDSHSTAGTVQTVYDSGNLTIYRWGRVIEVQARGVTGAPSSSSPVLAANVLADYKPKYNASAMVADASGNARFARMWVEASTGSVRLATTGYTSSSSWYGTLTYVC